MILFNLIPYREIERKRKIRIKLFSLLLVVFFAIVASFLLNQMVSFFSNHQEKRVLLLKEKVDSLSSDEKEIDLMDKKIQDVLRKKDVIESLTRRRYIALDVVRDLSSLAPSGLYFQSFTSVSSGDMDVLGVAVSNQAISDFLRKLDGSHVLELKTLVHTKILNTKFGSFQEFSLTVGLRHEPETVPVSLRVLLNKTKGNNTLPPMPFPVPSTGSAPFPSPTRT